jgi:hypothetical protein
LILSRRQYRKLWQALPYKWVFFSFGSELIVNNSNCDPMRVYIPVAWKENFDKGEAKKSGYKLKWLQQHGQAIVSNPNNSVT